MRHLIISALLVFALNGCLQTAAHAESFALHVLFEHAQHHTYGLKP